MIYVTFILFTTIILYVAFYQWQYFMIFRPTYYRDGELGDEFEILSITTQDGVELEGVVYERDEASSTMLFFGGRAQDSVGLIKKFAECYPNIRVVTFNYRSYGRSGGVASEKNIFSDGILVANLVQKYYGSFHLVGYSLGSSVASYVASRVEVLDLFLVGAFDSIASLAKEKYFAKLAFLSSNLLFRYRFETSLYVQNISSNIYLLESVDDEVVDIKNARKLKDSIKNLFFYEELDSVSHQDLLWHDSVVKKISEVVR